MKKLFVFIFCLLVGMNALSAQNYTVSVNKIWDNGKHCAFTSIVKFNGKYYCSFREAESHIFDKDGKAEGNVRIIASDDGVNWESVAFMHKPTFDLRDPKLSITPDGRMMVTIGGSIYKDKKLIERIPHVSFTKDGKTFTDPVPIKMDKGIGNGNDWLWRVTWDDKYGYGVVYSLYGPDEAKIALLKTSDGVNYELVTKLDVPDFPNETTVRIASDKQMKMMVRRERGDKKGYWGTSKPPYKDWEWTKMELAVGGPDFIFLDDETVIAGSRSYFIPSSVKTILLTGDMNGKFQETVVLPSGGDTSYPGFCIVGDELWVSYYSTHETPKASVYLAKLPLSTFVK